MNIPLALIGLMLLHTTKSKRSESKVTGEKFQHVNLFDQLVHLRIGLLESGAAERQNEI